MYFLFTDSLFKVHSGFIFFLDLACQIFPLWSSVKDEGKREGKRREGTEGGEREANSSQHRIGYSLLGQFWHHLVCHCNKQEHTHSNTLLQFECFYYKDILSTCNGILIRQTGSLHWITA